MPALTFNSLIEAALMAVVLLFSIIIHEVAHGYVAMMNGDPTARMLGRITLNPVPHIDPVGTVVLPLLLWITHSPFLFGWAKPVPVNPLNFRDLRWGEISVSLAGPLSNLLLAVFFGYLFQLAGGNPGLAKMAFHGCTINIFLALFNLVPLPPLDGSHILAAILPPPLARLYQHLEPVGFILVIVLFMSGVLGSLIMPIYRSLALFLLGGR